MVLIEYMLFFSSNLTTQSETDRLVGLSRLCVRCDNIFPMHDLDVIY